MRARARVRARVRVRVRVARVGHRGAGGEDGEAHDHVGNEADVPEDLRPAHHEVGEEEDPDDGHDEGHREERLALCAAAVRYGDREAEHDG